MVFSGHLEYQSRADIAFGKEYLQDDNLLQAFARCLPDFIATNPPEVSRRFVEDSVNHDGLWTSLLTSLPITESSESPLPFRFRVFENCCTVLNATLSTLEVSEKVDWRAPELSLLLQISTFGLRDKEVKIWNSYVNAAEATEMVNITARDGPLLIFCQLVHLVAISVPLDQYHLELKDIETLWELQRKLIEDQRLPLYFASCTVWEELDRLRGQVKDLCGKNIGKEEEVLQRQLWIIDDVSNLRASGSKDTSECESADGLNVKALAATNSTSSSRVSRGLSKQFSFASESTTAVGGSSSGSQTGEGEYGFTSTSSILIPRSYIDFQPECSADKFLDCEEKAHARSVSPQGYEAGFYGPASPWIIDRTSGIFRPSISPVVPLLAVPPVYTHVPHTADVRQRYGSTYTRWACSRVGARPNLFVRTHTGMMFRSRINVPTVLPSLTITPTFGSFDLSNQSDISPTFEEE